MHAQGYHTKKADCYKKLFSPFQVVNSMVLNGQVSVQVVKPCGRSSGSHKQRDKLQIIVKM